MMEHKTGQQTERAVIDLTTSTAGSAGRLVLRHILAGLICAGISCVAMSVFIIGMSVIVPVAGERVIITAFWICIGVFMAGTLMGFGRRDPKRALGCFTSIILSALAGPLLGIVLYGLFMFLGLPVYDGDPSSIWLPLGIGLLFGAIGWGNFLGWRSTKTIKIED